MTEPRVLLRSRDLLRLLSHVKPSTFRSWSRRGTVKPVACDVRTRALLFDYREVNQAGHRAEQYRQAHSKKSPTHPVAA